jgi:hypothetical protein
MGTDKCVSRSLGTNRVLSDAKGPGRRRLDSEQFRSAQGPAVPSVIR